MKFQKNNIIHYFVYSLGFFIYVVCIFIKFFNKNRKTNTVTLTGHKLFGNLEVLFNNQNQEKFIVNYITFNYQDYLDLKKFYKKKDLGKNIFYVLNPLHVYKALSSKLLIASHGVFLHKIITKHLSIKTLYCGHAIEGVYPIQKSNKLFKDLEYYSEVWMYSEFEKEMFLNEFNYPFNNLKVIGYPRVHYLKKNKKNQEILKELNDIKNKVVLYAPTASRNDKNFLNSSFSPFKLENLKKFESFFKKMNATLIVKTHLNDKFSDEVRNYLRSSTFIKHAKNLKIEYDYDLLIMSDLLLTDYSTIYADYLVLNRPIIFISPPDPNKNWQYSPVIENNKIQRVDNFNNLLSKIKKDLMINSEHKDALALKKLIFKNLEIDNILDNALQSIDDLMRI